MADMGTRERLWRSQTDGRCRRCGPHGIVRQSSRPCCTGCRRPHLRQCRPVSTNVLGDVSISRSTEVARMRRSYRTTVLLAATMGLLAITGLAGSRLLAGEDGRVDTAIAETELAARDAGIAAWSN